MIFQMVKYDEIVRKKYYSCYFYYDCICFEFALYLLKKNQIDCFLFYKLKKFYKFFISTIYFILNINLKKHKVSFVRIYIFNSYKFFLFWITTF